MGTRPTPSRSSNGRAVERVALLVAGIAIGLGVGRSGQAPASSHARAGNVPSDVSGTAHVIDGDTLEIAGVHVRIFGIDAPEHDQSCSRADGARYECGTFARDAMSEAVAGQQVTCTRRDTDPYGRMVGKCRAPAGDLGEILVREGAAIAYRHYSTDYVAAEEDARARHAGIWQGRFEAPWNFRHKGHRR